MRSVPAWFKGQKYGGARLVKAGVVFALRIAGYVLSSSPARAVIPRNALCQARCDRVLIRQQQFSRTRCTLPVCARTRATGQ